MANIDGIIGINIPVQTTPVNVILAAYGNDIVNLTTGLGYKQNLTSGSKAEFEIFLNHVFFQNYTEIPKSFNGSTWAFKHCSRVPKAKFIKKFKNRLYLGYCQFGTPQIPAGFNTGGDTAQMPSRVFYSDLTLGLNQSMTWGIEWGDNLKTVTDSPYVELYADSSPVIQNFKAANIKVGDPFFITDSGINSKQYFIDVVDSAYRIKLTEVVKSTATDKSWWCGGNWFDVGTDDGDQITGLGDNSDRLLIFKLLSLWFYTGSQLRQVKDAVGTSSNRSIINYGGYTYYFHGSDPAISGIYRYDGVSSVRISKAIDPFIQGMDTANYDDVVAWAEGEELRFFLGDLTNTNRNISMAKAVATLHTGTKAWDISPIADTITCSTVYRTNNRQDTYCGNSEGQVLKMHSGYNHNGDPIRMILEKEANYPGGSEIINDFTRIQVIGRATKGVKVKYKLRNKPKTVDENWQSIGELDADKTELTIPRSHSTASGIDLQFGEDGVLENDTYIEKVTVFYKPQRTRML